MAKCAVSSCDRDVRVNGYCNRHNEQVRKHGKITNAGPSYKDLNEIILCGDIAKIVLRSKKGDIAGYCMIDSCNVDAVKNVKWHMTSHGYCATKGKHGSAYIHQMFVDSDYVDHISMDKLDNRMSNIRPCSQSQNLANRLASKNSKTGVKGVHPFKGGPKFAAQITKTGKVYSLGVFYTIEDASLAYREKAAELFGEFARV